MASGILLRLGAAVQRAFEPEPCHLATAAWRGVDRSNVPLPIGSATKKRH